MRKRNSKYKNWKAKIIISLFSDDIIACQAIPREYNWNAIKSKEWFQYIRWDTKLIYRNP